MHSRAQAQSLDFLSKMTGLTALDLSCLEFNDAKHAAKSLSVLRAMPHLTDLTLASLTTETIGVLVSRCRC